MIHPISEIADKNNSVLNQLSVQKFIVTEGKTDSLLLKKVLGNLEHVGMKTGSGYSSALSLAGSVLTYHKKPVLLIVDTDSNEQAEVDEQERFVHNYLKTSTPGAVFKVIFVEPELEAIFFQDVTVAEHLLDRSLTQEELESARLHPKQFLKDNQVRDTSELIHKLDDDDIAKLKQLSTFKELQSFIDTRQ
jgi:hypothetical protein